MLCVCVKDPGQDREAFICGHKALMVQLSIGIFMKDSD